MLHDTEWGNKDDRYFLAREQEHIKALEATTSIW